MVKQLSPGAGPAEWSSGRHTLPEGIALRIALPSTLLASWFIILVLLSSILSLQVPLTHPTQLKKDCFLLRNYRQDRFNLRLTKKNDNHNNRSVLVLGHYVIFTPQRRSKHKSPISMSGGKQEWEITPAKVGFTPRNQEGSIGDNNNHNYGYIEDSKEKKIVGDPNEN